MAITVQMQFASAVSDRTAFLCSCCLALSPMREASALRKTRNQFVSKTRNQLYVMIAYRVERLCCLIIRIGHNCPKTPPVWAYQGKMTYESMVRRKGGRSHGR